jgi:hypothetical protein
MRNPEPVPNPSQVATSNRTIEARSASNACCRDVGVTVEELGPEVGEVMGLGAVEAGVDVGLTVTVTGD